MRATRRQLLGVSALLLVTGCREARTPGPTPVDPDDALRAAASDRERVLLRAYDAALLAAPALTARLSALRAEHVEHLAALTGPPVPGGPVTATPTGSPAPPSPAPPAAAPPSAAPPASVLAGLVRAEQAAAAGHLGGFGGASRPLAALLAVLAASEASHQVVLG